MVTVNLPISYDNVDYCALRTCYGEYSSNGYTHYVQIKTRELSYVVMYSGNNKYSELKWSAVVTIGLLTTN